MEYADAVTASLPQPLFLVDGDGCVIDLNPAAEVLLGTSAKHVTGAKIAKFLKSSNAAVTANLEAADGAMTARQTAIAVRGGLPATFDFSTFPLSGESDGRRAIMLVPRGHGTQLFALANDAQDKADMIAVDVLSHEIKNPLAAIAGAAQLLGRKITRDQQPMIDLIMSEVDRIVELLNKMGTGGSGPPLACVRTNIHAVIDEARLTVEAAELGKLEIAYDYDPSIPDVWADRTALIQVLTNLLSNAIEAIPETVKPRIKITTRYSFGGSFSTSQSGKPVRLPVEVVISDNGPGVPAELAGEIFSPFVTSKRTGQGLGLVVVRNLLTQMGGRISHERDESNGLTHFTVHLALASEAEK